MSDERPEFLHAVFHLSLGYDTNAAGDGYDLVLVLASCKRCGEHFDSIEATAAHGLGCERSREQADDGCERNDDDNNGSCPPSEPQP